MDIKPIKTEKDYQIALKYLDKNIDTELNSKDGDKLEILIILIDKYESENYPIEIPGPIEAIKFRMEQLGMLQKDLAKVVGFKSRISEILNKKRKLTLSMIRQLSDILSIPTDVLIQKY